MLSSAVFLFFLFILLLLLLQTQPLTTCLRGQGLCPDAVTCVSLQDGICPCNNGAKWCNETKTCIDSLLSCASQPTGCFLNQFLCSVIEAKENGTKFLRNTCTQTPNECNCLKLDSSKPYYCEFANICVSDPLICANVTKCPIGTTRCADYSCDSQANCNCKLMNKKWCQAKQQCIDVSAACEDPCASNADARFFCSFSQSCSRSELDCSCKANLQNATAVYCPLRSTCVARREECVDTRNECDRQLKVTCNYTTAGYPVVCGASLSHCEACQSRQQVPCDDGRCVDDLEVCKESATKFTCEQFSWTSCSSAGGAVRTCAAGPDDCAVEDYDCSLFGWTKCSPNDLNCYPDLTYCPADSCLAKGFTKCRDGSCKQFAAQCNANCDALSPFQCSDGRCVSNKLECKFEPCENATVRCSNGECIDPTRSSCCEQEGYFRCKATNQCVSRVEDCLVLNATSSCSADQIRCASGACVVSPRDCILPKCEGAKPIQCPDGSCRAVDGACACPRVENGTRANLYCPNTNTCIQAESHHQCYVCPRGTYRCPDGACYENAEACSNKTVAGGSSYLQCPPGQALCSKTQRCVVDKLQCNVRNCPVLCPASNDADQPRCALSIESCCPTGTSYCRFSGKCLQTEDMATTCTNNSSAVVCSADKPIQCHDKTCVADKLRCLCPDGYFKCPISGDCVSSSNQCLDQYSSKALCPNMVYCPEDSVCKTSNSLCGSPRVAPVGYKLCPNGVDVIPSEDSLGRCPKPVECPLTAPLLCRSSKTCVSDLSACPSLPRCGQGMFLCTTNGNKCVKSPDDCDAPVRCRDNQVQCPSSTECRDSYDQCPTRIVCPADKLLCADQVTCASTLTECNKLSSSCPNVTCPTGECKRSIEQCESPRTCPKDAPILCPNGECKADIATCSDGRCGSGFKRCPGVTNCVSSALECPTVARCPAGQPIMCADETCTSNLDDCKPVRTCQSGFTLCADGVTCAPQGKDALCPTTSVCPPSAPIKCAGSQRCVQSFEQCQAELDKKCPEGYYQCPNSECKKSLAHCSSAKICTAGVLCLDRSCRESSDKCPPTSPPTDVCSNPMFPFKCPDGKCYRDRFDCPQTRSCPYPLVDCNGSCVKDLESCPSKPRISCAADEYLCPNGVECAKMNSSTSCTPIPTCTDSLPVRCGDSTCRASVDECHIPSARNCTSQQLCWNGECLEVGAQCPPRPQVCPTTSPVLCPDWTCQESRHKCSDEFKCYPPYILCGRSKKCVASAAQCTSETPDRCAVGLFKCLDGSCVRKSTSCKNSDGCPLNLPIKCSKDGSCRASIADCNAVPLKACNAGYSKCEDGSCRASCANVLKNGCTSSTPKYCASSQACVDSTKECPSSSFCPDISMIKCPNGMCVKEQRHCIDPTFKEIGVCINSTSGQRPYPCASGVCVQVSSECLPLIPSCPSGQKRCENGICAPAEQCVGYNSTCPFRCETGQCVEFPGSCPIQNGCTANLPIKCESGRCVANANECSATSADASLANGCKTSVPIRCATTGACVSSDLQCANANRCPILFPIRCKQSGQCVASLDQCFKGEDALECGGVRCIDGSCVSYDMMCKTMQLCPLNKPVRCESGECRSRHEDCPATVRCSAEKPFKCADGSCAAAPQDCKPLSVPCPASSPFLCADQSCVTNPSDCQSKRCPPATPVRCKDSGICVSSTSECSQAGEDACLLNGWQSGKIFYCAFDRQCKASPNDCVNTDMRCFDAGEDGRKRDLVRCYDGTCASTAEKCKPVPACPFNLPFRCKDGSCATSKATCSSTDVTGCYEGTYKCSDSVCREICPDTKGCQMSQYTCPDLKCVEDLQNCRRCPTDSSRLLCWDGTCSANCTAPPAVQAAEITVFHSPVTVDISAQTTGSAQVTIPALSMINLDGNGFSTVRISTTDEVAAKKMYSDAASKRDQNGKQLWSICSNPIRISALNADGSELTHATLLTPASIRFQPLGKCLIQPTSAGGSSWNLGTLAAESRNLVLEGYLTSTTSEATTYLHGETQHFSDFVAVRQEAGAIEPIPSPVPSPKPQTSIYRPVAAANNIRMQFEFFAFFCMFAFMLFCWY